MLQLKGLETVANSRPTDAQAQYEFLRKLIQTNPEVVVDRVSHPMFRHFAVDQRIALLYLQALGQTQRHQSFNLDYLTSRLMEHDPAVQNAIREFSEESRKLTKPEQAAGLMRLLTSGGASALPGLGATASSGMGMALSQTRGTDPKLPLHVQLHNPTSTKAALIALTGRVLIAFVVVSAMSALLDEKGVGRGLGMNSGSKHIQQAQDTSNVSFDDVKGVEEAKNELQEIVMYLKNPAKFTRLGGKLPRGLLLTGPPGTGKTLLAKAIAGEADVPFFFSSGSQFEEVYVGLGAKRIRELFEAAKKKSPCIIFIDEIDAVGGSRQLKDQGALKMTLNELLVQMDGFEENNAVIVIGATNFSASLDQALLRPGRFDKHITVPLPDVGGRKEILAMYAKKTKLHPDVDLNVLARGTTGFSGADLFNLMNQAALKASVDGLSSITMGVLEYAKDKILMGAERKTAVITEKTAKCTAYHGAGHALVAVLTGGAMPSK
jgi:ATP-dependent metalloprotease